MDNQNEMDKRQGKQAEIFMAICLIALSISLIGNVLVEYFSK